MSYTAESYMINRIYLTDYLHCPHHHTLLSLHELPQTEVSCVERAPAASLRAPPGSARSRRPVFPPALTRRVCIKGSQSAPIMSTVSPDKRRKMESALNQLKKLTVVVADTGDFNGNNRPLLTLMLAWLAC